MLAATRRRPKPPAPPLPPPAPSPPSTPRRTAHAVAQEVGLRRLGLVQDKAQQRRHILRMAWVRAQLTLASLTLSRSLMHAPRRREAGGERRASDCAAAAHALRPRFGRRPPRLRPLTFSTCVSIVHHRLRPCSSDGLSLCPLPAAARVRRGWGV